MSISCRLRRSTRASRPSTLASRSSLEQRHSCSVTGIELEEVLARCFPASSTCADSSNCAARSRTFGSPALLFLAAARCSSFFGATRLVSFERNARPSRLKDFRIYSTASSSSNLLLPITGFSSLPRRSLDSSLMARSESLWPKIGSVWVSRADVFLVAQLAAIAAGFSELVMTVASGHSNRRYISCGGKILGTRLTVCWSTMFTIGAVDLDEQGGKWRVLNVYPDRLVKAAHLKHYRLSDPLEVSHLPLKHPSLTHSATRRPRTRHPPYEQVSRFRP